MATNDRFLEFWWETTNQSIALLPCGTNNKRVFREKTILYGINTAHALVALKKTVQKHQTNG